MRSADRDDAITLFYVPLGSALLILAITALLFQSMLATILGKRAVERAVEERTFELRELNATLNNEIDHRKDTEAELRISKEKAEAASRSKSIFLSTMSHELRTPLNAIIGFSELLIAKPFKEDRSKDYLGEIHGSGKKLLNLINDILDITQIDAEEATRFDLVYIPDIVAAAMDNLQPLADAAGVSLKCVVPDYLPSVLGDGRRLQKAIINLLSNSIKFGRRGGWAQVAVIHDSGFLVIAVSDNGVGMPPNAQTRISELFSQFDASLSRRYEGVGLGLTFVGRVADLHGASFRIKSDTGEGTTVTLTLPIARVNLVAKVA
jgi:signal transduction histidine kinase